MAAPSQTDLLAYKCKPDADWKTICKPSSVPLHTSTFDVRGLFKNRGKCLVLKIEESVVMISYRLGFYEIMHKVFPVLCPNSSRQLDGVFAFFLSQTTICVKKKKLAGREANCMQFLMYCVIFSSPAHEVLMVSYCDQSLSIVRRPCVVNFLL